MFNLLRGLISWLLRHALIFGLLVLALAAAWTLSAQNARRQSLQANLTVLEAQQRALAVDAAAQRAHIGETLAQIDGLERDALRRRLVDVRTEIAAMDRPRLSRTSLAVDVIRGDPQVIARDLGDSFRLQLLTREKDALVHWLAMLDGQAKLAGFAAEIGRTDARARNVRSRIADIERRNPFLTRVEGVPVLQAFVGPWRELRASRAEVTRLERRSAALRRAQASVRAGVLLARERYDAARGAMRAATAPGGELSTAIANGRGELAQDWTSRLLAAIAPVLGSAAWIMAAIIVAPVAVKAFWFYAVAPIAARLAPIRVRPDLGGDVDWATARLADATVRTGSAVSHRVLLHPGDELMIKPEYLQGSMTDARIDTAPLLNRAMVLTSLAAGLTALTRIRVDRAGSATLSATRDMVDEVGVIEIAAGSAMVLHPRNLAGVVQRIDQPVRIESRWRLGHPSAWLTLQLRYLVFHGPCALVVTGARGVALDPASNGRLIAGAATMGWSVGLAYSVRRNETFYAYLTGKQSLFNDRFEGTDGRVLYEQMPRAGAKSGFWGRGLEGIGDGVMKVFGL